MNATALAAVAFAAAAVVICWLCRTPKRPPLPPRPLYAAEPPQRMPVAPDARRRAASVHDTPAARQFISLVEAELKDYAAIYADLYDTDGGNR